MESIKQISTYVVFGFALSGASAILHSNFLSRYLQENLITLLIALLAINTTTISVVMTKLKEISDSKGGDFSSTIRELRNSIIEQVVLVVGASVLLILSDSEMVATAYAWIPFVLDGFKASLFVAGLWVLFDTAQAIFVILRFENQQKK